MTTRPTEAARGAARSLQRHGERRASRAAPLPPVSYTTSRDTTLAAPVHVLAIYPIANTSKTLPSRVEDANAKPLNSAMLAWFGYYYQKTSADGQDPRLNLVAADLHGLPPITIVNAAIDPLRSDGETLADALRAAGDKVEHRTFPGVTHEFFGMGKIVKGAHDAETFAVSRLRPALSGGMYLSAERRLAVCHRQGDPLRVAA